MNDIFEGDWKQIKGSVKEWWGDLTDDDITKIDGKRENLVGVLQTRYGYAKDKAEADINQHLDAWQKAQAKNEATAPTTKS